MLEVYVRRKDDPESAVLLRQLRSKGHSDLQGVAIERVYLLEGDVEVQRLLPLLVNPIFEEWSTDSSFDKAAGPIVEIRYKRAVTEPETKSMMDGAAILGITELEWARLSYRYHFVGISEAKAHEIAEESLYNPIIQVMIAPEEKWDSLKPHGSPEAVRSYSLIGLTDSELESMAEENSWYASLAQLKAVQSYEARLGRPLTDAEVEIIVQSWSDHCYHTTWKSLGLLKKLSGATKRIDHPLIVSVFHDNAGGMEFYDGQVVLIKGETHNFPTSIAPFGGVATKHGGVIRDAIGFGKGGYPIGGSTIMGTMDPTLKPEEVPGGALHPGHIVRESIRATAYYCNPMGIPMMFPVYRKHPGYTKCLALGHTVGIIPGEYALKDDPRPGDLVLLFGGGTGRDGIHGATASSAVMTGETVAKESAAVQIGDPITERKFMTAVPFLRDAGCIRSITDLGAGGISSAVGEMGSMTGVTIDLDLISLKDESLTAWEIILSESQERMLIAVPPERRDDAVKILERFDLAYTFAGVFTDDHRFTAFWKGAKAVDLDMDFLWEGCPIEPQDVSKPEKTLKPVSTPDTSNPVELMTRGSAILSHYHCCDQSSAGFQFDSTVQGRTVIGPYSGVTGKMPTGAFVAAPILGKPYGVVTSISFSPFWGEIGPSGLGRLSMVEAINRAVSVGGDPKAIALCDNFYTPRIQPEAAWELTEMVDTIADFSEALGMPFISGKDSSSGTFTSKDGKKIDVPPTLVVSAMGRIPDVTRCRKKPLKQPGSKLVVLGKIDGDRLGGSVYLDTMGERGSLLPDWGADWGSELLAIWNRLHLLYNSSEGDSILSAGAIGEGGIFVRAFEMAYGGSLGVRLNLAELSSSCTGRSDGLLFGEFVGATLLEVKADADLVSLFGDLPYVVAGEVTEERNFEIRGADGICIASIDDLANTWESTFKEVVL